MCSFWGVPKNAYFLINVFFGKNHIDLEFHHLQPSINGTGTAGYHKPKKAPTLRPLSQQNPKKDTFL
jgi:hypothetical protein